MFLVTWLLTSPSRPPPAPTYPTISVGTLTYLQYDAEAIKHVGIGASR